MWPVQSGPDSIPMIFVCVKGEIGVISSAGIFADLCWFLFVVLGGCRGGLLGVRAHGVRPYGCGGCGGGLCNVQLREPPRPCGAPLQGGEFWGLLFIPLLGGVAGVA